MKKIKEYWPFFIPLTVICVACYFWITNKTDPAPNLIVGTIETEYYDAASEIPGRMLVVLVEEGDTIKKGDILGQLKPNSKDAAQLQSSSALEAAQAQLDLLKNGARQEDVEAARNTYQIALEQLKLAKSTWARVESLYKDSVVSTEEKDIAFFKLNASKKEANIAYQHLIVLKKGAREESLRISEALKNEAEGFDDFVKNLGGDTDIAAPHDGVITNISTHEEAVVLTGSPLFTVMDHEDLYVIISVPQTMVNKFKLGDIVEGKIPGLNESNSKVKFKVTKRAAQLDFADWLPTNQRGDFDLKTFEIHLEPVGETKQMIPGMTVGFEI